MTNRFSGMLMYFLFFEFFNALNQSEITIETLCSPRFVQFHFIRRLQKYVGLVLIV